MSAKKLVCFHCQKEIPLLGPVGRREECPFCKVDLHCCKNCQHYDGKIYNECHEPQAERVLEKERANYCDFFSPQENVSSASRPQDLQSQQLAAAEALFKKNN